MKQRKQHTMSISCEPNRDSSIAFPGHCIPKPQTCERPFHMVVMMMRLLCLCLFVCVWLCVALVRHGCSSFRARTRGFYECGFAIHCHNAIMRFGGIVCREIEGIAIRTQMPERETEAEVGAWKTPWNIVFSSLAHKPNVDDQCIAGC